jgi:hypothetical protein
MRTACGNSPGRPTIAYLTPIMAIVNDREILAACLRWHTAHVHRLEIGAEQRRYQLAQKQRSGFGGSDYAISQRLTAAKRHELAGLRALAAICAKVRGSHIDDADVIDVPVLIASDRLGDTDTESILLNLIGQ